MKLKSTIGVISIATWAILASHSQAERPDLADVPLFIGNAVDPNLMFMMDDSGSMSWSYMPDDISGVCNNTTGVTGRARGRSPDYNKVYFDPAVVYEAPKKYDGTQLPDADFFNAWDNGYAQGSQTNLSTSFRATWYYSGGYSDSYCGEAGPADYYLYEPASACSGDAAPNDDKSGCYSRYEVANLTSDVQQNFANWYSYYRNRMFASRAAIGTAFSELPSNFRMGWGRLNSGSKTVDDANGIRAVEEGVRAYDSARKQAFYNWLYQVAPSGGTPLRRALEGAGSYFEGSDRAWADDPAQAVSTLSNDMRSCRQTFSVLMTDGYYSGSDPSTVHDRSLDNSGPSISGTDGSTYQYVPEYPFQYGSTTTPKRGNGDVINATLADVAMHYWKRDLKPALDNNVPTKTDGDLEQQSTAFWQHMSTFFVGLGVTGSVDPSDAWDAVKNNQSVDWWGGASYNDNRVNDMLHGGIVSQGGFSTAQNPAEFATNLLSTIAAAVNRASTATAIDFEASTAQAGSLAFSAQFDPNSWSGDLKAIAINNVNPPVIPDFDTQIAAGNGWSTRSLLKSRNLVADPRQVITYQPANSKGLAFNWANYSNLAPEQQADLSFSTTDTTLIENRLEYIRGDRSKRNEPEFHPREHRLGSIVNSSPHFVGEPASNWPNISNLGGGDNYSTFRKANSSRPPVVYVGANDGMLHAFSAEESIAAGGGRELFAYIPSFVYSDQAGEGLHYLTEPNYQHRYYVDLDTRSQDIHTQGRTSTGAVTTGKSWRTVLIGGARAGGKGLFALDITNPTTFSETNAEQLVMWEFTAADDARLGYMIQPPTIALARWGSSDLRWTAFFSNGYNSTTATTGFFMLDMEGGLDGSWVEGTDYKFIEFAAGGDGLSPLVELDMVGDYVAERVYAGDLDGNLWVATGDANGDWESAYEASGIPKPLFKANRPITGVPAVTANYDVQSTTGNQPNVLVYFGTGQYLEKNDIGSTGQDYIFGIWDSGEFDLDISDLEARSFAETTAPSNDGTAHKVRRSTGGAIDYTTENGWYIPLPDSGERITADPRTRFISEDLSKGVVYFNSMVPDTDPCAGGGTGWILAVGFDGTSPDEDAFLNFSGLNDPIAGFQVPGIPNPSTIWDDFLITPLTDGSIITTPLPPEFVPGLGRRGWQELF